MVGMCSSKAINVFENLQIPEIVKVQRAGMQQNENDLRPPLRLRGHLIKGRHFWAATLLRRFVEMHRANRDLMRLSYAVEPILQERLPQS